MRLCTQLALLALSVPPCARFGAIVLALASTAAAQDHHEHGIARGTAGHYVARNPGLGWSIDFDGRGFTAQPFSGRWSWGLELDQFGFSGETCAVSEPTGVQVDAGRVEYQWDRTLTEWYASDSRGFLHGYTLHEPPYRVGGAALLEFRLRVRGDLVPHVASNGRDVRFDSDRGSSVLAYAGLTVFDADGQPLSASFERDGADLLLAVDERGARYPITIDPIAFNAYLKASNTGAQDFFGRQVAASGSRVAVAADRESSAAVGVGGNENNDDAPGSGAVYLYAHDGVGWSQEAYLKASNTEASDTFGVSLALSDDLLVVGAYDEDSDADGVDGDQADNSAPSAGAAYVFRRVGTSWVQEAYLKASDSAADANFGFRVAASGSTVAVAALDTPPGSGTGAVYVFAHDGTTWTQQATLTASNADPGDNFGSAIALSGNTLVVGAWGEGSINTDETNNGTNCAGAAYVFVRNGTTWGQQAYLKASNPNGCDQFGLAVAVSGDTAVVGAPFEASSSTGVNSIPNNDLLWSGAAYVFHRTGTSWNEQAYLKAPEPGANDQFGHAVAIVGDRVFVAMPNEDSLTDSSAENAGAVFGFERSGTSWYPGAAITSPNAEYNDFFGLAMAASDTQLIVGAPFEDSTATGVNGDMSNNGAPRAGAAYAFELPPPLVADTESLSLSAGGEHTLTIDAGISRAGWIYWLFGSATGTSPGIAFGPGVLLPLNIDGYFWLTLTKPGLGIFTDFIGVLSASAQAEAKLTLPPGSDATLAGITLNHAYLATPTLGGSDFASNAVGAILVP